MDGTIWQSSSVISISYVKRGKTRSITSVGKGIATLFIPYAPRHNEIAGNLYGVSINSRGKASRIKGAKYDARRKGIVIPIGRLAFAYGVGYTPPRPAR